MGGCGVQPDRDDRTTCRAEQIEPDPVQLRPDGTSARDSRPCPATGDHVIPGVRAPARGASLRCPLVTLRPARRLSIVAKPPPFETTVHRQRGGHSTAAILPVVAQPGRCTSPGHDCLPPWRPCRGPASCQRRLPADPVRCGCDAPRLAVGIPTASSRPTSPDSNARSDCPSSVSTSGAARRPATHPSSHRLPTIRHPEIH